MLIALFQQINKTIMYAKIKIERDKITFLSSSKKIFKGLRKDEITIETKSIRKLKKDIELHNITIAKGITQQSRGQVVLNVSEPNESKKTKVKQTYKSDSKFISDGVLWDWSKVSGKNKTKLKTLYSQERWGDIFKIHNDLKLSPETYCCIGYKSKVHENMKHAKKLGII